MNIEEIKRFEHIIKEGFKFGFDVFLEKIHNKKFEVSKEHQEKPLEVRLRLVLESLGPTFIKLGQLLSIRPDLVPAEYCEELSKLQDSVKKMEFDEVKSAIEKEYGRSIEKVFKKLEKEPVASASISQVHKAILHNGKKVAVKVKRPGIEKIIREDIDIMKYIAVKLTKHFSEVAKWKPLRIIEEFERWTLNELNFLKEKENIFLIRENLKENKDIVVPETYDELCTNNILVTEFLEGVELNKIASSKKKFDIKRIFDIGFDAIMTQVFEYGFFHADPHPGNILIIQTKKGIKLGIVDFGIVGKFDKQLRKSAINLFLGMIDDDLDMIVENYIKITGGKANKNEFKQKIQDYVLRLKAKSITDAKISFAFERIIHIGREQDMHVPVEFVLFGKTLATLEGIALRYDPEFDFYSHCKNYMNELIIKEYIKKPNLVTLYKEYAKARDYIAEIAEKVKEEGLLAREININIDDSDIKKLALEMDKSSNRITYGLIIAAMVLAAAIIMTIDKGPYMFGIPVLSFIAIVIALLFTLILLISIFKEHALKR